MNEKSNIHIQLLGFLCFGLQIKSLFKVVILLSFGILYEMYCICCGKIGYWNLNKKIDRKHFQGNKGHIPHSIKLCLIIGCLCIIMHIKALDSPIGDVSKSHPLSYQLGCMLLPFIYVAYRCHLIDWHLIILYNMLSVL